MNTTDWTEALTRARARLATLSHEQKVAVALHDYDKVRDGQVIMFDYADGPNGVRGHPGATAFPSALALAASYDRQLAGEYGIALAREVLAAGRNAIFSPGLDITRVPHGGRAGQQLGEDPYLVGEVGGAVGHAVQTQGVLAVATHYVGNNFEWLRTGSGSSSRRTDAMDVRIGQRPLHELYLEPFRRALGRYGVAAFMGSYNRLNGEYVCQSPDLLGLPRRSWGWAGVSVPDFLWAVRDPRAALEAGLDLPSLGDAGGRTPEHVLASGEQRLDNLVLHVLTAAEQVSLKMPPASLSTPPDGSATMARRIATDGMVLLRNESALLPFVDVETVTVIDVVGARNVLVMGGAPSVSLMDDRIVSVAEALAAASGSVRRVRNFEVGHGEHALQALPEQATASGIQAEIHDLVTGEETRSDLSAFELGVGDVAATDWSAELRTTYRAEVEGQHTVTLEFSGEAELLIDGRMVTRGFREASPMITGPEYPLHAVVGLKEGQEVELLVRYRTGVAFAVPGMAVGPHLRLGVAAPDPQQQEAIQAAASSDAVVVLAGRLSGEAMDVESIRLPGAQEAILDAVLRANPRTVLVTLGAGPVVLPLDAWPDTWLHAWFPGEQFGPALADVLTGSHEPGGRLPVTFPMDEHSTPIQSAEQYPGVDGVVTYSEGLLVGYRWYDTHEVEPAFPFGHGLGYTSFDLGDLEVDLSGDFCHLTLDVRNRGDRAGKAVVQVYVQHPPEAASPPAQLKAFAVLRLAPGEIERTTMTVDLDDLKVFDEQHQTRRHIPGTYRLSVGFSSRDMRLSGSFDLVD